MNGTTQAILAALMRNGRCDARTSDRRRHAPLPPPIAEGLERKRALRCTRSDVQPGAGGQLRTDESRLRRRGRREQGGDLHADVEAKIGAKLALEVMPATGSSPSWLYCRSVGPATLPAVAKREIRDLLRGEPSGGCQDGRLDPDSTPD